MAIPTAIPEVPFARRLGYLEGSTGLPVTTVPDPELCVVKGLQKIILTKGYYKKLTYSMLDENYRWLR